MGPRLPFLLSTWLGVGAPPLSGQEVQVEGPPPQDPGLLLPLLPAVLFLLLAFLTWWIWRKLAE